MAEQQVEMVAVVGEHVLEVVAQGVGAAQSPAVQILVLGGGLVLVLSGVAHIIGGESVEAVLLLGVVVETGLKAQVEIVDYVPCGGAVDGPVAPDAQPVIVGY